jgi:hypothetical protein
VRLSEPAEKALYRCFSRLYHRNRTAFNAATTYEADIDRAFFNAYAVKEILSYPEFPSKEVDLNYRGHSKALAHIAWQVEEYWANLPTLLRWQEQALCAAAEASVRVRQAQVRVSVGQAVLLRGADQGTTEIAMSFESLGVAIQVITGKPASRATIKEALLWLDSSDAPFSVQSWGKAGKFNKSTIIKVEVPWMDTETWQRSGDEQEIFLTNQWLATHSNVLGEVYQSEAERKKALPERKAKMAAQHGEVLEQVEQWAKQDHFVSSPWRRTTTSVSPGVSRDQINPGEDQRMTLAELGRRYRATGEVDYGVLARTLDLTLT